MRNVFFVLKCLFMSVFKIRNLKTLFYRLTTVAIVIAHYMIVEKIPQENRVHNEKYLLGFIIGWHLVFMNFKYGEQSRLKKNEDYKVASIGILAVFGIASLLVVLSAPILAYFDFEVMHMETSYWTWRYTYMLLYIIFNVIINVFPLVNNFLFFITDGIILTQLTSLYLVNEFSMTALLTALPFMFVL